MSPLVAAARPADEVAEDVTETPAEQTVDDEVGRRVDDNQQVAEMRCIDERIWTVLVLRLLDRFEDGQDAVRRVAQYDDHDDDDDNVRDVLLLRTAQNTQRNIQLASRSGSVSVTNICNNTES